MMIKTLWSCEADKFDSMVNEALKEGYTLRLRGTREIAKDVIGFYAELDRPDDVEAEEVLAAVRKIRHFCSEQTKCEDCPLDCSNVCDICEPEGWELPDE